MIVLAKFDEDCYATDAVYTLYIPTLMAMPFIVLTEYRVSWDDIFPNMMIMKIKIYILTQSTYFLQWWLLSQLTLTIVSALVFECYNRFYDEDVFITNLFAIGKMKI